MTEKLGLLMTMEPKEGTNWVLEVTARGEVTARRTLEGKPERITFSEECNIAMVRTALKAIGFKMKRERVRV